MSWLANSIAKSFAKAVKNHAKHKRTFVEKILQSGFDDDDS
tara:strand:+ start:1927 stop:2049 length:123 start_codon:yes stop_codon:yes gene_type:complete